MNVTCSYLYSMSDTHEYIYSMHMHVVYYALYAHGCMMIPHACDMHVVCLIHACYC